MTKRELLALPALLLTKEMRKAREGDKPVLKKSMNYPYKEVETCKYSRFYRAYIEKDVLKVAIWERAQSRTGQNLQILRSI